MADQPGEARDNQENDNEGHLENPDRRNQGLTYGFLAFGAVVCVCVVAVALAFLFGRLLQPPSITQNVTVPPAVPASAPTPANLVSRDYSGGCGQAALPGVISAGSSYLPKNRQVAIERGAKYPLPQAGDSMTSSAEAILRNQFGTRRVRFLIRGEAPGMAASRGALPERLRPYVPNAQTAGNGGAAYYGAVAKDSGTPPAELSNLPDEEFQPVSAESGSLRVEVSRLMKTSKTEKYQAVKGLQFLVADLQITNTSSKDWTVRSDAMEVQEAGGISYGADPDLVEGGADSTVVEGGSTAAFTVAFQVPDNVDLKNIALVGPGTTPILIPLNKK